MGKYIKYDFADELWKTTDPEWVRKRDEDWDTWMKFHVVGSNLELTKPYLKMCERYFKKGEFNPDLKAPLNLTLKFFLTPLETLDQCLMFLAEAKSAELFTGVRGGIMSMSIINECYSARGFLDGKHDLLAELVTAGIDSYSTEMIEYGGFSTPAFPFPPQQSRKGRLGFYLTWIVRIREWLSRPVPHSNILYQRVVNHWFTCLPYVRKESILHENIAPQIYTIMQHVADYSPLSLSVPGAEEKNRFVKAFIHAYEQYGFHFDELEKLWEKAKSENYTAWTAALIDEKYVSGEDGPIFLEDFLRPWVLRGEKLNSGIFDDMISCFGAHNAIAGSPEVGFTYVRIDEYLEPAFIAELGFNEGDAVYAYRKSYTLSESFVGAPNVNIGVDLLALVPAKHMADCERPLFVMLYRTEKRYSVHESRPFLAHRLSLLFSLKKDYGHVFLRYFKFKDDPSNDVFYALGELQVAVRYLSQQDIPFHDSNHHVLKTGDYGLLMDQAFKVVETVDAPDFDKLGEGI